MHVAAPSASGVPEFHGRDPPRSRGGHPRWACGQIAHGRNLLLRAPKPGAKPFAEVGKQVEIGDTLCVIEAMKIFNQIETDKAGIVTSGI